MRRRKKRGNRHDQETGIFEPGLPITLALIKASFDQESEQVNPDEYVPDPDYDLDQYIRELGLLKQGLRPEDILAIDCPHCGAASYYDGGFTDTCSCCGFYNLANYSDEAYTLLDYWEMCWTDHELFGEEAGHGVQKEEEGKDAHADSGGGQRGSGDH